MGNSTREELLTEYYKLIDLVYRFDDYFIRIKTASISLGAISTGIGLGIQPFYPFILVILLALAFWLTESSLKVVQLSNFKRIDELEDALGSRSYENSPCVTPRIIRAYSEKRKSNQDSRLWLKVMWWKHVMFPHVLFLAGGSLGIAISLISLMA